MPARRCKARLTLTGGSVLLHLITWAENKSSFPFGAKRSSATPGGHMRNCFRLCLVLLLATAALSLGAEPSPVVDVSNLALPAGTAAVVDSRLKQAAGEVEIVGPLGEVPLAVAQGEGAKRSGGRLTRVQQREHVSQLSRKHDELMQAVRAMDGHEIARLTKALNAVVMSVDASRVSAIAGLSNVVSIRPVGVYQLDLSETVPYIGAKPLQDAAFKGDGLTVPVLHTGSDYT